MSVGPGGTEIGRLTVRVLPDTSDFRRDLQNDLERIERQIGDLEIDIVPNLEGGAFAAAARFAEAIVDAETGGRIEIPIEPDLDRSRFLGVPGDRGLAGRRTELPDLDPVERQFRRINDQAERLFRTLGGPAARGATIAGAIAAAASLATPLVGAFQVLPGLAALALGPIAAVTLGFEGAERGAQNINDELAGIPDRIEGFLETAVNNVVQSLNDASTTISDGFSGIAQSLIPVSQEIAAVIDEAERSGQLERIFDSIASLTREIADSGVIQDLGDLILDATEGGLEALPGVFQAIRDAFSDPRFQRALGRIIDELPGALDDLETFIREGLPPTLEFIAGLFELSGAITQAAREVSAIADDINEIDVGQFAEDTGRDILGLDDIVAGATERFEQFQAVLSFLRENDALGFLTQTASDIIGIDDLVEGARERFTQFQSFLDFMREIDALGFLVQTARDIIGIDDLVQGARDRFRQFQGALTAVQRVGGAAISELRRIVGSFSERARAGLASAGDAASDLGRRADEVRRGFVNAVSGAIEAVSGLPGRIRSALSGVSLTDIGSRIIGSLVDGLEEGFSAVQRTLNNLTALIPDWKGPLDEDRRLLREPADAIVDGFVDQLESRFGDIRRTFGDFPVDVDTAATPGGLNQTFVVDPRADEGFVAAVAGRAGREASRSLNLRFGVV